MNLRSPADKRCSSLRVPAIPDRRTLDRSLQTFPPESYTDLVRRRGGLISVPRRILAPPDSGAQRPAKLLLNVTVERSLGPVQVVMPPDSSVGDLIMAAVEAHRREKRRPPLTEADPRRFELHYSPFSLESLEAQEELINLGSRNFFLCSKPSPSCSDEATNNATKAALPMTNFMDFLL